MGIQGREVKQSHAVYHEAGQMVGRQTVAQPHCQIERLGVVHLFACSTHAQEYTITDGGYVLLSDKLLAGFIPHSLLDCTERGLYFQRSVHVYQMGSGFPRQLHTSAHASLRLLTLMK